MIISGGRAIAQGPLDSILETPESAYAVRLRGETSNTLKTLKAEPWVRSVDARRRGDVEQWLVRVTDSPAAADRLVPTLLADDACDVLEFHLSDRRLEDAYLGLVGIDDDD